MYTTELIRKIWNDKDGYSIEVGPDADGLDLVEIRCRDDQGKIYARLVMTPEQARLVADAVRACSAETEKNQVE